MKCECGKEFIKPKSLTNHRRWHNLPKYKRFQESFVEKMNASYTTEKRITAAKKSWEKNRIKLTDSIKKACSSISGKELRRINAINLWKNKEYRKKVLAKCMIRRLPTSFEKKVLSVIEKHKLPYKYVGNGSFWIENINPDFINTNGKKIMIETYWSGYKLKHFSTIGVFKDQRVNLAKIYGWSVIFIDENELDEKTILEKLTL